MRDMCAQKIVVSRPGIAIVTIKMIDNLRPLLCTTVKCVTFSDCCYHVMEPIFSGGTYGPCFSYNYKL